ncbi:MAG: tripartite tricarboxylate transporter substrate binding protein, partial [Burkholderiales bacterium]
ATPHDIIARINADVNAILASPEARERLVADGQEPGGGTPEDFDRFIRNEIAKYIKVIQAAGIKAE